MLKNIPQFLIDEIIRSKMLFDYYDYDSMDVDGYIFLTKMIQLKQYRQNNKLINFIESSKNPNEIFNIAIDNGLLNKNQINPDLLITVDTQIKKRDCNNCKICYNEIKEIFAFIPCGHTDICPVCFENMKEKTKMQCPICRKDILMHIKIYS